MGTRTLDVTGGAARSTCRLCALGAEGQALCIQRHDRPGPRGWGGRFPSRETCRSGGSVPEPGEAGGTPGSCPRGQRVLGLTSCQWGCAPSPAGPPVAGPCAGGLGPPSCGWCLPVALGVTLPLRCARDVGASLRVCLPPQTTRSPRGDLPPSLGQRPAACPPPGPGGSRQAVACPACR